MREVSNQLLQLPFDDLEALPHLQHRRIVHDVLCRGPPVNVSCRLFITMLIQLEDQRQDGIADYICIPSQPFEAALVVSFVESQFFEELHTL